jgi:hypothetical protein
MAKRSRQSLNDFSSDRDIIEYKPVLSFEEPPQIEGEQQQEEDKTTIDEVIQRTQTLIDEYQKLEQLTDIAQARIDQRAKGFIVNLDPAADAPIIEAIKRHFPDKENPATITFEEYRECLKDINNHIEDRLPAIDPAKVDQASSDPFRTDFGGRGKPDGLNRPDLNSDGRIVDPLDLIKFQNDQIKKLFEMLKPQVKDLIKKMVPGI